MKRNAWLMFILSVTVFLGFPWLAVTFSPKDAGMLVTIVLFYVLYPFYSAGVGIYAGRAVRTRWMFPVVCSVLFLLGAWAFFQLWEVAFVYQAGVYLAISLLAMAVTHAVCKKQ